MKNANPIAPKKRGVEISQQSFIWSFRECCLKTYQILSGPSGRGVDDYFTPEINSSASSSAPTDPSQPDWTTDNLFTQQYDNYKVQAVINWIEGRSTTATDYAQQFLLNYNDSTASVDGKPVTSAGLSQVYTGAAAAQLIGVAGSDPRVPDVIGIAQYGVVYTGHKAKIAEHGGDHVEDRNVPILLARPGAPGGTAVTKPVETTQIAPTILKLLGLNPHELEAVHIEGTPALF